MIDQRDQGPPWEPPTEPGFGSTPRKASLERTRGPSDAAGSSDQRLMSRFSSPHAARDAKKTDVYMPVCTYLNTIPVGTCCRQ